MNISVNFLNEIWKYESNQNLWQQLLRGLKLWIIYQIKLASIWQKLVWVGFHLWKPLSTPIRNSSGPQVNLCWECQISANFQERGHEEHFADIWPEIRYLPSTYWPASHFAISSISFCICICVFSFYLNSRFCFCFCVLEVVFGQQLRYLPSTYWPAFHLQSHQSHNDEDDQDHDDYDQRNRFYS